MNPVGRRSKLFASALFGLFLTLAVHVTPAPVLTVIPSEASISVGQTQQFMASGSITPTGVSAGGEYTCVRLPDGTAQCSGRNHFGQLGNGRFDDGPVPRLTQVSGVITATRVAAGDEFGCALLADGTARCWGLGHKGQRGDGTFDPFSAVPVAVSGLNGAVDVSGGYDHACALLADGTIQCWGSNLDGQLGNPSTPSGSSVPVVVSGLTADAMSTGADHACAVLADRTLRCWGKNHTGQLGDGTLESSATPVPVNGITDAAGVKGGGFHTCAVLQEGTVQCWGENEIGQLGDGTRRRSTTPVQVVGIANAVAVTAGWRHSCGLLVDGTVRCWGDNEFGQLGNGTTTSSSTPVQVTGITDAVAVSASWWHHSCALLEDGTVRCWGANDWGQLANGTTTGSSIPVAMTGSGVTWTSSNTSVATVDVSGRATGVSAGTTTITATDRSGANASATLTVRELSTLSVIRSGSGAGTVSSSQPGISCGTDCSESYDSNSSVTLTATADSRSTFFGWIGCDAVSGTTCTVTMGTTRTVTAIFDLRRFGLTVNRAGVGSSLGSVSSSPSGISCGTDCYEPYNIDTLVTLTADPSALFTGWSGCDSVSGASCRVTMGSERSVTARFVGVP
jgi:alpha-tubulin suppressor-like RCC1 family protein